MPVRLPRPRPAGDHLVRHRHGTGPGGAPSTRPTPTRAMRARPGRAAVRMGNDGQRARSLNLVIASGNSVSDSTRNVGSSRACGVPLDGGPRAPMDERCVHARSDRWTQNQLPSPYDLGLCAAWMPSEPLVRKSRCQKNGSQTAVTRSAAPTCVPAGERGGKSLVLEGVRDCLSGIPPAVRPCRAPLRNPLRPYLRGKLLKAQVRAPGKGCCGRFDNPPCPLLVSGWC